MDRVINVYIFSTMKKDMCYEWLDTWINILVMYLCMRCVSHMASVVLYGLTCLSFFKYYFDGFPSLSMCSPSYIFIYKITVILMLFTFSIKDESDGAFCRSFLTVFVPRMNACARSHDTGKPPHYGAGHEAGA